MNFQTWFDTFKTSWIDSLRFFLRENIKNFLLVSLKAFKDFFFKKDFVTIMGSVIILVLSLIRNSQLLSVFLFIFVFWLVFLLLSLRPSISQKNSKYFFSNIYKPFFLVILLTVIEMIFLNQGLSYFGVPQGNLFFVPDLKIYIILTSFSPLVIFFILFLYDSESAAKYYFLAFWRAIKMFFFNYPFCFIILNIFSLFLNLIFFCLNSFFQINNSILLLMILSAGIIIPFYCCIFTNFYIKRLHDQFRLYYPK